MKNTRATIGVNAKAEMVQKIPAGMSIRVDWPANDLLQACGATILVDGLSRVVEIRGRKFCKGVMGSTMRAMDEDIAEARGEGHPNETEKISEQEKVTREMRLGRAIDNQKIRGD